MPVITYTNYDFRRPEGPMSIEEFWRLKGFDTTGFEEYCSAVFAARKRQFWDREAIVAEIGFVGGPISVGLLALFREDVPWFAAIAAFGVFFAIIAALKFLLGGMTFVMAEFGFRRWFMEMRHCVLLADSYEGYLISQGFLKNPEKKGSPTRRYRQPR